MATLADVWSRLVENQAGRSARDSRRLDYSARLRPFPNEDVLFFSKHIDNSGVVREADPAVRGRCWKLIGSAMGAAVLLICVLLPSSYGLLAGYQIQKLNEEARQLNAEHDSLELEQAGLFSQAKMEELARELQFVDPAPQRVVHLDDQQGSLAMNRK